MTIKTVDQQRFDELTEWCRNRPEDAAVRIIHAEDWEDSVHPDMLQKRENLHSDGPRFQVLEFRGGGALPGHSEFLIKAYTSRSAEKLANMRRTRERITIHGFDCEIIRGNEDTGEFVASNIYSRGPRPWHF